MNIQNHNFLKNIPVVINLLNAPNVATIMSFSSKTGLTICLLVCPPVITFTFNGKLSVNQLANSCRKLRLFVSNQLKLFVLKLYY